MGLPNGCGALSPNTPLGPFRGTLTHVSTRHEERAVPFEGGAFEWLREDVRRVVVSCDTAHLDDPVRYILAHTEITTCDVAGAVGDLTFTS